MAAKGTSLRQYALTRIALVIPMVFILLTLVFLLMRVAPGDPISSALGGRVPKEEVDKIKAELGFDRPISRKFALTANLAANITAIGDVIVNGQVVDDVIATAYQFSIGFVFR